MVEPVDPFQCRELDLFDVPPRAVRPDQFGLVQAVDRLGERVVVRVADAANGSGDPGLLESLRVANAEKLNAAVAVMNQLFEVASLMERRPYVDVS